MLRLILMIAILASPLLAQEIVISGNPTLLFSTANPFGPYGSESFINSINNPYGPLGGETFFGSFNNEFGVGLSPKSLAKVTPYIPFTITPRDILDSIEIRPVEITPLELTPVVP